MKKYLAFIAFTLCGFSLYAQDIITKRDGTDIQAKVTEVGQTEISYKKFSNLDGPTYTMDIADVLMITYQNGEREMYNVDSNVNKSALPTGIMTYNSWSGKISVGGVTIENEMLDRYLAAEELAAFKSGRAMATVGGIMSIVGAIPFGGGVGYLIGWNIGGGGVPSGSYARSYNAATTMAIVGGVLFAAGLAINIPGEAKVKKVVNNYNAALTYRPTLSIGATPNGVGLAFVF